MTARAVGKGHRIDLTLGRSQVVIGLSGDIDILAEPDLINLLGSLERIHNDVHVDLAEVTFMDSGGLRPIIEATRRRRELQLPPLVLKQCSTSVCRLLNALGMGAGPVLDVARWDQVANAYPSSPSVA